MNRSGVPGRKVFKDVFASTAGTDCSRFLHRAEGLTWGPDGRLYVTGFAASRNTTNADVRPAKWPR